VRAIDTNIVARALLDDDPVQSPVARRILDEGAFVSLTVLLETAWLLRSRYGFNREAVSDYLKALAMLPTVSIPDPELINWAIDRHRDRGDPADLIHLVAARGASEFATFDETVIRDAAPDSPIAILIPS
jgi:predicted nucleic-acid-binding protein